MKVLEKYSLRDRIYHAISGDYPKHGCIISNPTKSIQYVGLTLNNGQMLVHDCSSFQL